jgi:hypothetical protein
MTEAPQVSTTIIRIGSIIEIEGTGASITFYPYDKDKTYYDLIEKLKDLGQDLTSNIDDDEVRWERRNIDIQLTEIYEEYFQSLQRKQINDEDHLLIVANAQIKHKFQDQKADIML